VLSDILPGGTDSTSASKNPSSELTSSLGPDLQSTDAQSAAEGPATAAPVGEEVACREGGKVGESLENGASSHSGGSVAGGGGVNGKKVLTPPPFSSIPPLPLASLQDAV